MSTSCVAFKKMILYLTNIIARVIMIKNRGARYGLRGSVAPTLNLMWIMPP